MPGTDGLALARAIRADPALAATRLILLTPYGRTPTAEVLAATGVARSQFKPVRPAQLFDNLDRALRGASADAVPSPPPGGEQVPGQPAAPPAHPRGRG